MLPLYVTGGGLRHAGPADVRGARPGSSARCALQHGHRVDEQLATGTPEGVTDVEQPVQPCRVGDGSLGRRRAGADPVATSSVRCRATTDGLGRPNQSASAPSQPCGRVSGAPDVTTDAG